MRYFKCLSEGYNSFKYGESYSEKTKDNDKTHTVLYYTEEYPDDWEEVTNPKQTIDAYEIF